MDLIVTHTAADFDALSSCVAAQKLYPGAKILLPGSQERNVRDFLSLWQDKIKTEQEKEINFYTVTRLIVVETRLASRIGKAASIVGNKGVEIHIYDHHPKSKYDIKAQRDVFLSVGSTTSILVNLIRKKKIPISPLEATIMALGIYEDTGSLTFQTTSKLDIDMVGFLFSKGANLSVVSSYLKQELSTEELNFLSRLMNSTEIHFINGINIAITTQTETGFVEELALLTHKLIDIENYNVIFVMVKIDSKIQMIARSRLSYVNVARIVEHFDGGGHPYAASAMIREQDVQKTKKKLIDLLKIYIKPRIYAKDIMSYPVKTVLVNQKITDAKRLLSRLHINAMPVIDKGKLAGIIGGREIRKAIRRGFGHSKVKGYMWPNISYAVLRTPLHKIQTMMSKAKIGLLPVLNKNRLAGVVTRNDLLRIMHHDLVKKARPQKVTHKKTPKIINISRKLRITLPKKLFQILKFIGNIADSTGFKVFVVGGFVRDVLLGVKNYDVDVVVENDAINFAKILADKLHGALVIHKKFGTATVVMGWPRDLPLPKAYRLAKFKIDVATARAEYYEYPAALPTVQFSSIKQDLYRRDFTINAMAVGLNKDNFGSLVDFFGGQRDLRTKKIRVLHDLSFVEDPTRIFRAVRFEQRYGFKIEPHTQRLIKTALTLDMFGRTQKQRLREEIILLLSEEKPKRAIFRLSELHELRFIHPDLKLTKKIIRLVENAEKALSRYRLSFLKKRRPLDIWLVYFMALLDELNFVQTANICNKFVFTKGDEKRILSYKKNSKRILKFLDNTGNIKPSRIFKILEPLSYEVILLIMAKSKSNRVKKRISNFFARHSGTKVSIRGADLKNLGLKPGPNFKKIFEEILYAKIDGSLKTKEEELDYVKNRLLAK